MAYAWNKINVGKGGTTRAGSGGGGGRVGAGGTGVGSAFGNILSQRAPKAAITRQKVEMPTYPGGPDPTRPVIPGVSRSDFGLLREARF